MAKDWKDRLGVVYSTNSDFEYQKDEEESAETLPANKQKLVISLDKKARKGKKVTLVEGFVGTNDDLKELGKMLKQKCGVGGSVKDNQVIIQGDFRERVADILKGMDYKTKLK